MPVCPPTPSYIIPLTMRLFCHFYKYPWSLANGYTMPSPARLDDPEQDAMTLVSSQDLPSALPTDQISSVEIKINGLTVDKFEPQIGVTSEKLKHRPRSLSGELDILYGLPCGLTLIGPSYLHFCQNHSLTCLPKQIFCADHHSQLDWFITCRNKCLDLSSSIYRRICPW